MAAFTVGASQVGGSAMIGGVAEAPLFGGVQDNPVRRKQTGLLHIGASLLLTTLAVATVNVPRLPLVTKYQPKPAAQQPQQPPNLLTGTLAVPAQAPFAQKHWPNPTGRRFNADLRTFVAPAIKAAAAASPIVPVASPNPLVRGYPIALRTLTNQSFVLSIAPVNAVPRTPFSTRYYQRLVAQAGPPPNVIPLNAPAVDNIPPSTVVMHLPSGASWVPRLSQDGVNAGRSLSAGVAEPFRQAVWPNPAAAKRATSGMEAPSVRAEEALPFKPVELPTPRVLTRPIEQQAQQLALILAKPFLQDTWPTPRAAPHLPFGWTQETPLAAGTATGDPFSQLHWPNPMAPRQPAQSWISAPQIVAPAEQPFRQADWKNPILLRSYLAALGMWTNTLPLPHSNEQPPPTWFAQTFTRDGRVAMLSQDGVRGTRAVLATPPATPPISQTSWPVPAGARPNIALRTWLNTLPAPLDGGEQPPLTWHIQSFVRDGSAALRSQDGVRGTRAVLVGPPETPPISQTSWPVPAGARASITLRTWLNTLPAPHDGGAKPFLQDYWPVPAGYPPLVELRAWAQRTSLSLIVVPGVPFFMNDWPVPAGARRIRPDMAEAPPFAASAYAIKPFQQADWPVPLAPRRNPQDWTSPATAAVTPFAQADWPVPAGPIYSVGLRTWAPQIALALFVEPGTPFAQLEWPVPRGYEPNFNRAWSQPPNIADIPLAPVEPPAPSPEPGGGGGGGSSSAFA